MCDVNSSFLTKISGQINSISSLFEYDIKRCEIVRSYTDITLPMLRVTHLFKADRLPIIFSLIKCQKQY